MKIQGSLHRHLLGVFLLASGCAEAYDDFRSEENDLHCELRMACNEEVSCVPDLTFHEKDECTRFRVTKADSCIRQLEDFLESVEENPGMCDERPWFDIEACEQATESKNTIKCNNQVVAGRPLQHEGQWVLPAVTHGDAWAEDAVAHVAIDDPAVARAAAEHWLEVARIEHASVASFARASLELMSVGAPPHLLEGCHQAAMDEVRHARMALDVARALGDRSWDLGAIASVPTRPSSLRQIALDALLEGCIGEGGAAASAHLAAQRAEGPLADVLRRIAVDETQHAALAWATVRWALQQDASLVTVLREALELARADRRGRLESSDAQPRLAALGVVTAQEAVAIELDVIERIVEPVLTQLVQQTQAPVVRA